MKEQITYRKKFHYIPEKIRYLVGTDFYLKCYFTVNEAHSCLEKRGEGEREKVPVFLEH